MDKRSSDYATLKMYPRTRDSLRLLAAMKKSSMIQVLDNLVATELLRLTAKQVVKESLKGKTKNGGKK